ncbi:hypothetical protein [Thiothrix unzii]|jgi:hypothetical protein|uniref:Uncharacterized protein n=1 Tax=Thiothrix unzii TaxID=111769 RepID=A0A975FCQ4_9GAMM|nr:hypothetical protein [Thiothrix unzii]QTR55457.1 hypothetical protein J9260_18345 [Thiothrix unzii]QTR55467.1 hypothetical protein J9260_18295 [Thiothrix unzii]
MDCLLVGGAPSVGKSHLIHGLALWILNKPGFLLASAKSYNSNALNSLNNNPFVDFMAVIDGVNTFNKKIRIIVNSATDDVNIINNFKGFFDANGGYDILISSVRDGDLRNGNFWPRQEFFQIMNLNSISNLILELPLAKVTRRRNSQSAYNWYETETSRLAQHILSRNPFNL